MDIALNPVCHDTTKHIAVKYHFIREGIGDRVVKLEFCPTSDNLADILTKVLPKNKFNFLR